MNSLQELNLISVLKKLDDDTLKRVFNKSNPLRLHNNLCDTVCDICRYTVALHNRCSSCDKPKCYMLYRETFCCYERVCLDCLEGYSFYSKKISDYYKIYADNGTLKYSISVYITGNLPEKLTYKKVCKIIKIKIINKEISCDTSP